MYGASGKMGRGGTAGRRNIHAPPINRAAPGGRLSMGGGPRGRGAAVSSPATSSRQVEESFNLVRENPLNFGMAIKLAPDLVEEIKRVEAQGGTARIKFDANANNPNGNVIHVGNKTFKFTWSREPGDLCDIYEERQSGEDGNGLLVESGGSWRKLNVERELDESTKNHVKMRSEEAERKHKSRKAIVLDHQNPAMKNQMKAFAASESNQRNFKHRKEPPFKKPKPEQTSGGPSKNVYKSVLPTSNLSKGRLSAGSPLSSQPDQHVAPVSPVGSGDLVKGNVGVPDVAERQNMSKASSSDKDMINKKPSSTISEKYKHTRTMEAKPADLRSLMISLLKEHQSMGMSLKALEKAIEDAMPNSARKIDPILKQIAIFQTPGRYFLKPVETESFKKLSQSGSSPEITRDRSPAHQKFDEFPAQDPSISMATALNDEAELNPAPVHTAEIQEKNDTVQNSLQNFGDINVTKDSEGMAGSSSDSGSDSDSDSDSSDSGSDSGSHSKSKSPSPVGSHSGSSSDSETDASSSSKQASDEEVDIMTSDDDKEPRHKLPDSDPISSSNPVAWSHLDNETVDIGNYETQDHYASEVIEIEKDSPEDDHDAERPADNYLSANNEGQEHIDQLKPSSADHYEQERQVFERETYDGGPDSLVNDGLKNGQPGTIERSSKGKSKRRSDDKHADGRTHNKKRSKSKSSRPNVHGTLNSIFGDSPNNSHPDKLLEGLDMEHVDLMENRTTGDYTNGPYLQTGSDRVISTRPVSDFQQPGQRLSEAHAWTGEKRPGKHKSMDRGIKHSERSLQTNEAPQVRKGFNAEAQSEVGLVNERWPLKSSTGVGDRPPPVIESHNRKSEMMGKVKEASHNSNSYMGYSPKDNNTNTSDRSPLMNGRSGALRREYSDLEMGEFREPSREETPGSKKQFERKSSFKNLENKPTDSDYWNSDFSRGKTSNKISADLGKMSPPNAEAVVSSITDGIYKKKAQENSVDDHVRPHHRSTRPLDLHHQSRGDHIDVGSQQNAVLEMIGKSRFAEAGMDRGPSSNSVVDTSRKMPVNSTEHDPIRGLIVGSRGAKEIKKQKPKMVGVSNDRQVDAFTGGNDGSQNKKVSSSDENISTYTKYEKEEPELKGPINDISQYKIYVKEYQEKYESYSSLSKILESYRDEFDKLGKDLEAYKGDTKRYHDIVEHMRSSFRQCGERHKRLKRIFVVLYEELKHLKQRIKDYANS
ncbi:hypothetical protein ACS0TY_035273 [Phlomoides rotata]